MIDVDGTTETNLEEYILHDTGGKVVSEGAEDKNEDNKAREVAHCC